MKILHVFKVYHPVVGGIQNHVQVLSEELVKDKDFEVEVLVANVKSNTVIEHTNNVRVIKAGRIAQVASTPVSISLFRYMKAARPDILHLHFPYPPGELASLFLSTCDKVVVTYHSDIVKQRLWLYVYKPFLRRILEKAKVVIASNPNSVDSSVWLNRFRRKTEVIPFGIDLEEFQAADRRRVSVIKEEYDSPIVLFVGRLCYYKGIKHLLEAARRVDARFVLIGDGPLRSDLEELVEEPELQGKVSLLGKVSREELCSYYQAADVLVLPSTHRSEAFGIVLLEGMACGLPLITTELGTGTSFVNLHNQTGLVVPPRNSETLAKAINRLLDDRELRLKFAQEARKRVELEFSKEKMTQRIKELYHRVLTA